MSDFVVATSQPQRGIVLIAAISARALSEQARKAGFEPRVADLFGDEDTRVSATQYCRVKGSLQAGFDFPSLAQTLENLARDCWPVGLVLGAGFEQDPQEIAKLAKTHMLLGCSAKSVMRVKYPPSLAALCAAFSMSHPPLSMRRPSAGANATGDWLVKEIGAAGGAHIQPADAHRDFSPPHYFQKRLPGESLSALALANGKTASIVGFTRQWADPIDGAPFRYGGACRPAILPSEIVTSIEIFAQKIALEADLRGLISFDFLWDGKTIVLLEINPRPGATLDVYSSENGVLFSAHVAACQGREIDQNMFENAWDYKAQAASVFYAPGALTIPADRVWPEFCADRPQAGKILSAHDPLCTIHVHGDDAEDADNRLRLARNSLTRSVRSNFSSKNML